VHCGGRVSTATAFRRGCAPFYYLGPQRHERREFLAGRTYNVSTEYTEHMIVFAATTSRRRLADVVSTYTKRQAHVPIREPEGESRRWPNTR